MAIKGVELFHGSLLARLMRESPAAVRLLEHEPEEYGVYTVDGLRDHEQPTLFYLKHSVTPRRPKRLKGWYWSFTFNESHLTKLRSFSGGVGFRVALICGKTNLKNKTPPMQICILEGREVASLIDMDAHASQWIRVEYRVGEWLKVTGSAYSQAGPMNIPGSRLNKLVNGAYAV